MGSTGSSGSIRWHNASRLSPEVITQRATALKLDMPAFAACVDSTRFDAEIAQDQREGSAAGVEGTPSFIVGRTTPNGLDGIGLSVPCPTRSSTSG